MAGKKKFDYGIITRQLTPPIDGVYHWAAQVRFDGESPNHNFTEMYGQTEAEAQERMRGQVEWMLKGRSAAGRL